MADQLSDDEEDSIKRYRSIRAAIHSFVSTVVDRVAKELKDNGLRNAGKIDLVFKLLGKKMTELKQLDENIEAGAPANEVGSDVKLSMHFYFDNLNKIVEAVSGMEEEKIMLAKIERLFPLFEMPASDGAMLERPKVVAPEITPHQRPMIQFIRPMTKSSHQRAYMLPLHQMPGFNGNRVNWASFWDAYEREVHNDPKLVDAQKFSCLKALLDGNKFGVIHDLYTNNTNYKRAVALLKSKYGSGETVSFYRTGLLDLKPVHESCSNLQTFFFNMDSKICKLESLGMTGDFFCQLVPPLLNKLPVDLRRRIYQNQQLDEGDVLTMDAFRNALWDMVSPEFILP